MSTVRVPIFSPDRVAAILSLGWDHTIERPADELLAIMQRFADQAAIAWQNALRVEARRQADTLRETLERVVALAPTFHITGTREEVAQAICEAAVNTFDCSGASLYRVEGDRLRVLDSAPRLESLSRGKTFPLTEDMPLVARDAFAHTHLRPRRQRSEPLHPALAGGGRAPGGHAFRPVRAHPLRRARSSESPGSQLGASPARSPTSSFLVIVERFADQVALALTNASAERLHARLEASLSPSTPIDHPLLDVVTRYRTGEQRLRLGGDFVGSTPDQGRAAAASSSAT